MNTDNKERIYNLLVELKDTEEKKKSSAAAFREEVKRLKAEIAELMEDEKEKGSTTKIEEEKG